MPDVAPILKQLYGDAFLRTNCSGFFKAVAKQLGVTLPDVTADQLIDYISSTGAEWIEVGKGADDGRQAAQYAAQGHLVVALLKAADHCRCLTPCLGEACA